MNVLGDNALESFNTEFQEIGGLRNLLLGDGEISWQQDAAVCRLIFIGRSQHRLAKSRGTLRYRQRSATVYARDPRWRVGPQTLVATNHLVRRKPLWLRRFDWSS